MCSHREWQVCVSSRFMRVHGGRSKTTEEARRKRCYVSTEPHRVQEESELSPDHPVHSSKENLYLHFSGYLACTYLFHKGPNRPLKDHRMQFKFLLFRSVPLICSDVEMSKNKVRRAKPREWLFRLGQAGLVTTLSL